MAFSVNYKGADVMPNLVPIITATIVVTAIGLLCSVMLVIASKAFAVKVDEKCEKIRECLPGANCGACGYAGCDSYAKALSLAEETNTGLCTPGAAKVASDIANLLGVAPAEVTRKAARVHCNGNCDNTSKKAVFMGSQSCASAKLLYGGDGKCIYGCLGFGDCVTVCEYDAIHVTNGVAQVDISSCTACSRCVRACPNNLIEIVPVDKYTVVKCSNEEKGAVARKNCNVACIGCMKCERICPTNAIVVKDNLARINYVRCIACGECAAACPTGAIEYNK